MKSTFSSSSLRQIIWPIEWHEYKKFFPMAAMMFCILFNYSSLRSIKDGLVITGIGPEAISFIKTYVVLPSAIISMIIYSELCNVISPTKVFYTITGFFLIYIAIFAFVIYPNPGFLHPDPVAIDALSHTYPNFKWFIKIAGSWGYVSFYTIAELWGSMMLSLLFWQFANQITKTDEAKRFYSMFGLLGNSALPLAAVVISYSLTDTTTDLSEFTGYTLLFTIIIISGIITSLLYAWINHNVLTDPALYSPSSNKKKRKAKLSLMDSFKMIFTSKYLGLIAILVLSYGISINLVEGVWKSKVQQLYTTKEAVTIYMAQFQALQGIGTIIFMIIGSNILRKTSWGFAASLTPIMILITGSAFFAFIFFDNIIAMHITGFLASGPLVIVVMIGMVQNVLSKATKYSLFDSTKEMAYIPLDDELKTKGKAAVDVIGGRFGKSGGGVIQSTFFMLFPAFSFNEATPYFAIVFFGIVILWLYGIKALDKEYNSVLSDK